MGHHLQSISHLFLKAINFTARDRFTDIGIWICRDIPK